MRRYRDLFVDLLCVVFAILVALLTAGDADATGRVTGEAVFWHLVVATLGALTLFWRRRFPVAVAVLLAPVSVYTDFVGGAGVVALYTVVTRRRWPVILAVTGLHLAAGAVYSVVRPDPELSVVGMNILTVAVLAVTVAVGVTVRHRREMVASLRERAARAETEAELRADQVRALERERIAREMHDVLAHRISMVSLHAGALEVRTDLGRDEVSKLAGTIRASAHEALEDLRDILGVLRGAETGEPRPQPGLAELDSLVAECRSTGTEVILDDRLPAAPVPALAGRTAYRVVQEGLTNARKHAPGEPVRVCLDRTDAGELHIRLSNRLAVPVTPAIPGARAGLVGLAERVSLAGGRLDHGARRGTGGTVEFDLEVWLPWPT